MIRKARKGRVLGAVLAIVAGVLAYYLFPTVTTHTVSTTTVLTAGAPGDATGRTVEIGPLGTTPINTVNLKSPAPYGDSLEALYTTASYAGVPDQITLGSTMTGPWALRVTVRPSIGVRIVPLVAEVWTQMPLTPATDMRTVYTLDPAPKAQNGTISLAGNGQRVLASVIYALVASRTGKYTVTFTGNGQTVRAPLTVEAIPGGYAVAQNKYAPAPSEFGIQTTAVAKGTAIDFSVQGTLSNPDHAINYRAHLTAPVKTYQGASMVKVPAIGPNTAGQITASFTSNVVGVQMYGGVGYAPGVTTLVHDPARAVTSTTHNPLWLILGAGLAILALVLPGRRSRDGGDEGDGQGDRIS